LQILFKFFQLLPMKLTAWCPATINSWKDQPVNAYLMVHQRSMDVA